MRHKIDSKWGGLDVHDVEAVFDEFEKRGKTITEIRLNVTMALRVSAFPDTKIDHATVREINLVGLIGHMRTADIFLDSELPDFEFDIKTTE